MEETPKEPELRLLQPVVNEVDHKLLYQALKSNPILLQYLRATLYNNAMSLLRSPLPVAVDDVRYITAHAQTRGVCQLAEALLYIVEEGDKVYASRS